MLARIYRDMTAGESRKDEQVVAEWNLPVGEVDLGASPSAYHLYLCY